MRRCWFGAAAPGAVLAVTILLRLMRCGGPPTADVRRDVSFVGEDYRDGGWGLFPMFSATDRVGRRLNEAFAVIGAGVSPMSPARSPPIGEWRNGSADRVGRMSTERERRVSRSGMQIKRIENRRWCLRSAWTH